MSSAFFFVLFANLFPPSNQTVPVLKKNSARRIAACSAYPEREVETDQGIEYAGLNKQLEQIGH